MALAQRKRHNEGAAETHFALHRDVSAVEFDQLFSQGQPDARPRLQTHRRLVDLVELAFGAPSSPRLFGNKDELLAEWQTKTEGRLSQVAPQSTDE